MNGLTQRSYQTGSVARLVCESVDALAAPKMRNAIIELALGWARLDTIPEAGPAVEEFVRGPLFLASEQVLGRELAETIRDSLLPTAQMVSECDEISMIRSTPPSADEEDFPELSFAPPPNSTPADPTRTPSSTPPLTATDPAPQIVPTVLVASVDPRSVQELSASLSGAAYVDPVRDALSILHELGERTPIVAIDCRRPAVSIETLLALAPEFPEGSHVVLWGERDDLEEHLASVGMLVPSSWVCCGPDAKAEDIAAVCRILMD